RLDSPPRFPGDGAARVTEPGTARVTPAAGLPDGAQIEADQGQDGSRRSRSGRDGDSREEVA
ncbi:MAG: hypothetical protein ACRDP7_35905, partial [Trebonia sp.]